MKTGPTDRDEARERAAKRLFAAARGVDPKVTVTFAEVQAAARARRYGATHAPGRLVVGASVVVAVLSVLGSVAASRGWRARPRPPALTVVSVPAGASTRLERRGRLRVSVRGPASLAVGADDETLRVDDGDLVLANEGPPITVEAGAHRLELPPSAIVALEAGQQGAWRARALDGAEARLDGAALARPAPAPAPKEAPPPPVAPPPIPAAPRIEPHPPRPLPNARPAPAAEPSPAALEVAGVHEALARLRAGHDPAGALRLLDQHDGRYPDGLLRDEAAAIRVEALLALGRLDEALERLQALPAAVLNGSPRLRVTRGELLAARGRCPDAIADFAAVLSAAPDGEIEQRARRGRAMCGL
jgi:hypothetical protein